MKIRIKILSLLLIGLCTTGQSQLYPGLAGVQYSVGSTLGDTKNFVSDLSWTGFAVEYDKFLSRNLTVGFLTGWNSFDELQRKGTIELEGSTLTGTQIRYFSSFPVLANFNYFFGHKKSSVRPYFGIGVGTYYIIERLEVGLFMVEKDNWHFGLAPTVGILFPTDYIFLQLNVRYNHAFEGGTSITKEPVEFTYLTFNVGISVPTW
jgi:outer membrane protein